MANSGEQSVASLYSRAGSRRLYAARASFSRRFFFLFLLSFNIGFSSSSSVRTSSSPSASPKDIYPVIRKIYNPQCSFVEYRGYKACRRRRIFSSLSRSLKFGPPQVIYRRYASLFFIVGAEQDTEARTLAFFSEKVFCEREREADSSHFFFQKSAKRRTSSAFWSSSTRSSRRTMGGVFVLFHIFNIHKSLLPAVAGWTSTSSRSASSTSCSTWRRRTSFWTRW